MKQKLNSDFVNVQLHKYNIITLAKDYIFLNIAAHTVIHSSVVYT